MILAGQCTIRRVVSGLSCAAALVAAGEGLAKVPQAAKAPVVSAVHAATADDDEDLATTGTATAAAGPAAAAAGAGTSAGSLVTLGLIDGETEGKYSAVTIRLDHAPAWKSVGEIKDHGSFLQLTLPGTLVPEPGKFYDGGNPDLPKIAVFQITPADAAIRLFTNKDAALIKQALTAELLGTRIVITVDHAKLAAAMAAAAPSSSGQAPAAVGAITLPAADGTHQEPGITAEAVIARTEVRHDIAAPSDLLKHDRAAIGSPPTGGGLAFGGIDLRQKLVTVTIFSVFMLCLLGASALARPFLRRRRVAKGLPIQDVSLKTLASMQVAARQKVSLIQVGDERILIGVTPEAVTFLTAVGRQGAATVAAAQPFQRYLGADTDSDTVELRPTPVLKHLEGNDPETLRQRPRRPAGAPNSPAVAAPSAMTSPRPPQRVPSPHGAPVKQKPKPAPTRVNVSVGEDGVKDMRSSPAQAAIEGGGQRAIDDVTRLIREKLKTLRTI